MVVFFDELGNKKDLIVKKGDLIYLNDVVLATNVDEFAPKVEEIEGKQVLSVLVKLSGVTFTMQYVIN